jgi:hypothetical protein
MRQILRAISIAERTLVLPLRVHQLCASQTVVGAEDAHAHALSLSHFPRLEIAQLGAGQLARLGNRS